MRRRGSGRLGMDGGQDCGAQHDLSAPGASGVFSSSAGVGTNLSGPPVKEPFAQ